MKLLTIGIDRNVGNEITLRNLFERMGIQQFLFDESGQFPGKVSPVVNLLWVSIPLQGKSWAVILNGLHLTGLDPDYFFYSECDTPEEEYNQQDFRQKKVPQINQPVSLRKINLPTLNGFRRFDLQTIVRCESSDNYTQVYFLDRKKIVISKTLQEFETQLSTSGFFRVHQKHLINTEHIVEYRKGKGGQLIMIDDSCIDVSVRKKPEFIRYMNEFY